jgi:ABC-type multidrug transport system ATPase subunit
LCDKIAIMINGRFVVFGSPNYLMATYGLGYSFTVTINTENISRVIAKQTLKEVLPSVEFIDDRETLSDKKCWHLNYKVLNVKGGRTSKDSSQ